MNIQRTLWRTAFALAASFAIAGALAADPPKAPAAAAKPAASTPPPVPEYTGPTEVAAPLSLAAGKSTLVRVNGEATRLSVGNPDVADVLLVNSREVYVLGKKPGSTNVFVWTKRGPTTVMDVRVGLDTGDIKSKLNALVPSEPGVAVESLADSVVLSGRVADALKAHRLVSLAETYSGKKVVNLLSVESAQQVMLEVKVAEVSKTLLDKLGVEFNLTRAGGSTTFTLLTDLLTGSASTLTATRASGRTHVSLDAEVKNGLIKILAEPTIIAISGQEGAFLAGGKIFIPVPQSSAFGASTITLEEKEFGVGLRFTPTVLEDARINLRVTPEVSELSPLGTPVTTLTGQTSILPFITTRRASTTVQLRDGESFAIGGLVKSNVTEAIKALPVLGELPVLGALFRSSEFQTDRSELLFIVTPRLVKPLAAAPALPTDSFNEPSRAEFMLGGRMEGPPAPAGATPGGSRSGGFQLK